MSVVAALSISPERLFSKIGERLRSKKAKRKAARECKEERKARALAVAAWVVEVAREQPNNLFVREALDKGPASCGPRPQIHMTEVCPAVRERWLAGRMEELRRQGRIPKETPKRSSDEDSISEPAPPYAAKVPNAKSFWAPPVPPTSYQNHRLGSEVGSTISDRPEPRQSVFSKLTQSVWKGLDKMGLLEEVPDRHRSFAEWLRDRPSPSR